MIFILYRKELGSHDVASIVRPYFSTLSSAAAGHDGGGGGNVFGAEHVPRDVRPGGRVVRPSTFQLGLNI
jgi:hypothetical protein